MVSPVFKFIFLTILIGMFTPYEFKDVLYTLTTVVACLYFGTLMYINILAEYLHNNLKKEKLTHILGVRMPQRINIPNTPDVNERPVLSVGERVNLETI